MSRARARAAVLHAPRPVAPETDVFFQTAISPSLTRSVPSSSPHAPQTISWRKKITPEKLVDFFRAALDDANPSKTALVDLAGGKGSPPPPAPPPRAEGEDLVHVPEPPVPPSPAQRALPETEAYAHLLALIHLTDAGDPAVLPASAAATRRLAAFNRRTLDALAARVAFYHSLAHERHGELSDARGPLLAMHRQAALRHDEIGQETILNLLLRNYLHYGAYDQAEKLRSKAQLPASRSNQQQCRYLYHLGRIRAIQLEYSDAKECLTQAHRKAPGTARGFALEVSKWIVVVRLLLGEIPDKRDLVAGGAATRDALVPYLELTQAVRLGDLEKFRAVTETRGAAFARDKTTNLIARLRRNVIRVGLRRVSLAYSAISLDDVAAKLGLAPGDDVERVVAKAIRDGGVDAVIDHEAGCMRSLETADVYSTREPQAAFHARIAFCLDAHNEAVRALRYPPAVKKGKGTDGGVSAKDLDALELELAMDDDDALDEF